MSAWAQRAFGGVLKLLAVLLPTDFLEQYGDEMRWARERRLSRAAERGLASVIRAGVGELVDVVRTGVREWNHAVRDASSDRGRTQGMKGEWMGMFWQDARLALRGLRKNPGFAAVAVITLGVGIGASTAIFSVVDAALFRALPYESGERLAIVWARSRESDDVLRSWVSYPDYSDMVSEQTSFDAIGGYRNGPVTLMDGDAPTSIQAIYGTASLFDVAGVEPAEGRVILPSEDVVGGAKVAVISHGLWETRFGSDPGVVGRTVGIDGDLHTIVGIMPAGYAFPRPADVWLPGVQNLGEDDRGAHRMRVLGRLAPERTLETATEEVASIALRLEEAYPESNHDTSMWAESLQEAIVSNSRQMLMTLLGAVGLVLLIVCANVANLLLARATSRRREVAVRTALGATRGRLLGQFLVEGLVLAGAGGLLGIGLARVGLRVILSAAPAAAIPRVSEVGLNPWVLSVAGMVTLATAVLFGLVPAMRGRGTGESDDLRRSEAERTGTGGSRVRSGLVVLETALAMILIFASGLLVRSFQAVEAVDPGFAPENLWVVPVVLPFVQYQGDRWPEVEALFRDAVRDTREIPGVSAAAITYEPPTRSSWTTSFTISGRPAPGAGERPEVQYRPISDGYFQTAGIEFVSGRDFSADDDANAPGVVIVNEAFVRQHFPDEDPLGREIEKESWWEGTPEGLWRIVGVVQDVRFGDRENDARAAFYFPHAQRPMTDMSLVFRTSRDLGEVMPLVRETIWRTDPTIPLETVRAAESDLQASVAGRRFSTGLMGVFGVIALVIAAGGLFGVLSYSVSMRTREMGIRMSLGAGQREVRRMVLGQALRLVGGGLGVGLAGVLFVDRMVSSMLYGVGGTDPVTLVIVASLMVAVAVVSAYGPARKATRVDPVAALRAE